MVNATACAIEGPTSVSCIDAGDTAYMLLSTALVWFMTPGLAFFYGGLVREKNFLNTLYMNVAALAVITVQYMFIGYTFAFGWFSKGFGGGEWVGLRDLGDGPNPDYSPTIPHAIYCFYQLTFAMVTPAIISGAVVERISFRAWVVFIFLWATLVYDPLAHWVWSAKTTDSGYETGWLRSLGAEDFAGGTVVHMSSGFSALIACIICGPRRNVDLRSPPDGHNVPMFVLGTVMLWFGWFGFNGGSTLAAGPTAALAMYNTQLAPATAFATWMLFDAVTKRAVTVVGPLSGSIVGLVVITPCSGFVSLQGAMAIGCISSCVLWILVYIKARYLSGRWFMKYVDDSLDVFLCHGVGGMLGAFLLGWFGSKDANSSGLDGILYGGGGALLGWQVIAILMTIALSVTNTTVILLFIRFTIGIRYTRAEEDKGVDVVAHRQVAYRFEDDQIDDALREGEEERERALLERVDEWTILNVLTNQYKSLFGKQKAEPSKETEMKDVNGDDDWERKKGKENDDTGDDRSQIVFGGRFGQASYAVNKDAV